MTTNASTAIDARTYADMSMREKLDYEISILNNPLTKKKDRKVAQWRFNNIKQEAVEWCIAPIQLLSSFEEGTVQHDALMSILQTNQEICRIIHDFEAAGK